MKKVLVLASTALVVLAASQFAANVGATSQTSINRRVAALEKNVVVLQKRLKTAQGQVTTLRNDWTCLHARGLKQVGNLGLPHRGFQYSDDGGKTFSLLPALTFDDQSPYPSGNPDVRVVITDEGCLPGAD